MSISNAVGTTSSASSGRRTITVRAINRLAVAEARLYSLCAASCATGQSVTLRQLAAVTGPTGHPIGLRPALDTVRDLVDSGLLTPTGLALATPDSPRHVHIPAAPYKPFHPRPCGPSRWSMHRRRQRAGSAVSPSPPACPPTSGPA
ncbi:hypothetical protein ACN24M_01260 [Streptomyces microflavus]